MTNQVDSPKLSMLRWFGKALGPPMALAVIVAGLLANNRRDLVASIHDVDGISLTYRSSYYHKMSPVCGCFHYHPALWRGIAFAAMESTIYPINIDGNNIRTSYAIFANTPSPISVVPTQFNLKSAQYYGKIPREAELNSLTVGNYILGKDATPTIIHDNDVSIIEQVETDQPLHIFSASKSPFGAWNPRNGSQVSLRGINGKSYLS